MAKKSVKSEKLTKAQLNSLSTVGISGAKTAEEARTIMIEYLVKNEIEDCDDDSFEDLFEMVEAIYEDSDEEMEAAVEEMEAEEIEEDEADEEDDEDEDDEEIEDEEDEEEIEAKLKKQAKKERKKNDTVQNKKQKKVKVKFDPKNNPEDAKIFDPIVELFEENGVSVETNILTNKGITVFAKNENSKKVIIAFFGSKFVDGELIGKVNIPTIKDEDTLAEIFGDDVETKMEGNCRISRDVSFEELLATIKLKWELFEGIVSKLIKKDEKLGKNRKKMEDNLKAEKVAKATKKKVVKKEASEDVDVKKSTTKKKATKKKATKKK